MATVKFKGQDHLNTKVKVTENYEISILAQFLWKFFYQWCLFGVMSQSKGQGHLVKFGAIVHYHLLLSIFSPFECWYDISSDYYIGRF